jgi:hypothetical protein
MRRIAVWCTIEEPNWMYTELYMEMNGMSLLSLKRRILGSNRGSGKRALAHWQQPVGELTAGWRGLRGAKAWWLILIRLLTEVASEKQTTTQL